MKSGYGDMRRSRRAWLGAAVACAALALWGVWGCGIAAARDAQDARNPAPARLQVLAGTTLIEDLVRAVGGGRVSVRAIIPGGACPGHHDVRASDVTAFGTADLILLHDWQCGQAHIRALLDTAPGAAGRVRVPEAPGNWMLPEAQARAAMAVGGLLAAADPDGAAAYSRRAAERAARARAVGGEVRALASASGIAGVPAIGDVMQRPMLEWLGLRVVGDYGRFEETGAEALARTVAAGKAARAALVADNLQSTGGAGRALAEDMDARLVVLTNFPGGFPDTPDWESSFRRNADMVMAAARGAAPAPTSAPTSAMETAP
ncbi:metal ABC transporter solute-binding protein, Zn/Mn family [Nitratidesulfovibrio sp. 1201_IL3209]|uniref:metal ABC transporter solute-binding protein, Zn/Mn family n=1 Tax=Nitratidesulfovibrio sp. 1201_IL3209 TaxID=3084053 RepID=UPI002FDA5BEC